MRCAGLACSDSSGRLAQFGGEDRDGLGSAGPGVVALERVEREAHADGFVIFVAASEEMRLALFGGPLEERARELRKRPAFMQVTPGFSSNMMSQLSNRIPKVRRRLR